MPDSSNFPFEINIYWNALREDRIDLHSTSGDTSLIFIVDGAIAVNSLVKRTPISWNMVVPPGNTADVNVALHEAQERYVVDPAGLLVDETKDERRVSGRAGGGRPGIFTPPLTGDCHLAHRHTRTIVFALLRKALLLCRSS